VDTFEDKVAFVTGGASGIGLGIVKAFLGAGMRVVIADISDRHLDGTREEFEGDEVVHIIKLDVTDRAAMKAAAEETVARFGAVHVLVNNAGVGVLGPIELAGYDDWDWSMGVNLGGVFNGIHEFLPKLLEHGDGGHIVNTASKAALIPIPNCSFYCAAKAALVGLSESLRGELGPKGIGVSVFCPGPVRSNIQEVVARKGKVIAIERIKELCELGRGNMRKYGFLKSGRVELFCRNGTEGFNKEAPFDGIIAAAAGEKPPKAWLKQLELGGRLVAPFSTSIWLYVKKSDNDCHATILCLHDD